MTRPDSQSRPTNRRRLVRAVGGLVVLLVAGQTLPRTVGAVMHSRDLVLEQRQLLARRRADVAALDRLADSARVVQASVLALAPRILAGSSAAEAGDDLAARAALAVTRSAGRLLATEALTDSTVAGGLARAAVRLRFEGDGRVVVGTLRALEREAVVLALEELRLLAVNPGSPATEPEILRVELTLRGWYQVRSATP